MPKPYNPHDKLMVKAKQEGFRARSVYKLQELDEKFYFLKPGIKVLDIGAAPGSWLQYSSQIIGPKGLTIGVDLKPIDFIADNVQTIISDISDLQSLITNLKSTGTSVFDLILSDIAPNTTGIPGVDQKKSIELEVLVVNLAKDVLAPQGNLVMKVFQGQDLPSFLKSLHHLFRQVKTIKVKASRDRSKEVYVVCLSKR